MSATRDRRWISESRRSVGFCFEKNERAQKAIRRLGCRRIERAVKSVEYRAKPEAIHGARKDIKKARAVLSLAREQISRKKYRGIKKRLRNAAACLAKPRDAAIKVETLRNLTRRFKSDLPSGAFRKFRIQLRRAYDNAMSIFADKEAAKSAIEYLCAAEQEFKRLRIRKDGWNAIAPGAQESYRQCRDAHRRATRVNSPKRFHEWRKRSKNLWHLLVLLKPIWPEQLDRMACELEAVGDLLGEDHDLFILEQEILDWQSQEPRSRRHEAKLLRNLIHSRQADLRRQALAMGRYFYTQKPSDFCARLGAYWESWT